MSEKDRSVPNPVPVAVIYYRNISPQQRVTVVNTRVMQPIHECAEGLL